jgi:hypothetical protein
MVAKAYILYRKKREESRDENRVMVEVGKTMDEYLDKSDWRVFMVTEITTTRLLEERSWAKLLRRLSKEREL